MQIARRYLVPRQLEEHGLEKKLVRFPDATIAPRVIEQLHPRGGCAQWTAEIAALTRKAREDRRTKKPFQKPLTILPTDVAQVV